jgi:hypothetical protein
MLIRPEYCTVRDEPYGEGMVPRRRMLKWRRLFWLSVLLWIAVLFYLFGRP